MDPRSRAAERQPADPAARPELPILEPRQRWRITFRRSRDAGAATHREIADAWIAGLSAAGLPLPQLERARPRPALAFALPLPAGMPAERELADLFLAARLPIRQVREAIARSLPDGIELLDLHDVWLGEPPLAASVVAAVYRVRLAPTAEHDIGVLGDGAAALIAARSLPRERAKGGGTVAYDLRPLLEAIEAERVDGAAALRITVCFHPERGAGRPEEVVAALGDTVGRSLEVAETVRERLVLAARKPEEPRPRRRPPPSAGRSSRSVDADPAPA